MNHRSSRQGGMTLISFLLLFAMIGFYVLLGLKMTPIYIEYYKVNTVLKNLNQEPDILDKSPREVMSLLQKRWDVNDINRISADKSMTIEKTSTGKPFTIQLDYEREEAIVGNVSVLVKFNQSYEIGGSD